MKNFIQKKQVKITIWVLAILIVLGAIIGGVIFAVKNSSSKSTINGITNKIIKWSEKNFDSKKKVFVSNPIDYCEKLLDSDIFWDNSTSGKKIMNEFNQIQHILITNGWPIGIEDGMKMGIINQGNNIFNSIRDFGIMGCVLYKCLQTNRLLFNNLLMYGDLDLISFNMFFYGVNDLKKIGQSSYIKSLSKQNENIFKTNTESIKWYDDKNKEDCQFETTLTNTKAWPKPNDYWKKKPGSLCVLDIGTVITTLNGHDFSQSISLFFTPPTPKINTLGAVLPSFKANIQDNDPKV